MPATATSATHILGVRHHGPGSARSVRAALQTLKPSIVLVEGPPDADAMIPLLGHAAMTPPVALLVYRPEAPRESAYYPFAEFSPEWQALKYALDRGIPARFMDLPIGHQLGETNGEGDGESKPEGSAPSPRRPVDPLGMLAEAAGFEDGERWWEFVVEGRRDGADLLAAILDAMDEVRRSVPAEEDLRERRREAHMRQTIRAARAEGHESIAVICGAWHAPALRDEAWPPVAEDAALLKGLPKTKVVATWVPWTYGHLSRDSGYGAGIESPGWYDHLWTAPDQVVERWLTRVARLLREERLDASSASVIEAVRLADALATMRGRPLADLADLEEATRTVLCFGDETPMRLIRRKLVVGERLGRVPDETPSVPIQQDLNRLQKRLRLAPDPSQTVKTLDLREPTDLERSRLLHRLDLLGVAWGRVAGASGRGTFKEAWELCWKPELAVAIIEASVWGTTVEEAATALATDRCRQANDLPALTELLDRAILADLPAAVAAIMDRVEALAAVSADVAQLLAALPPLANLTRYGSVRQTDAVAVAHAASGMVARACIGLPLACASLDDAAAAAMFGAILRADAAIGLMGLADDLSTWHDALAKLAHSESIHGLVAGRAARILLDASRLDAAEVARLMNLAVSPAADPPHAAAWVEGFLKGSGEILYHDDALFRLFDAWLAGLSPDAFPTLLPMLRRTFTSFEAPLLRNLGERAKRAGTATPTEKFTPSTSGVDLDHDRAAKVLPLVSLLLGLGRGRRMSTPTADDERLRRWRLVLGGESAEGTGVALAGDDLAMDGALAQLYGEGEKSRNVGMGKSAPKVARWLGDIRKFFPTPVVQMLQKDALERLDLRQMLKQPELLRAVQPDVHLVANLLSLGSVLPPETRETARQVVRAVVEQLEKRLAEPTRQAVIGSLDRASRNRRPRHNEIDWNRTIRANLRHYQAEYRTVIPETRIGYGRKRKALREIVLCVDQSGSMATSVVYAGIFGAVLASLPALQTRVVVYDTAVVDLTAELHDPVDLLFGTQLGGGNDTPRALTYCAGLVTRPEDTILVLISDLYEGAGSDAMLKLLGGFVGSGVQVIGLLALSDDGAPSYDHDNARRMADLGIPVFACTPDLFPDLMAAAIARRDLSAWAASRDIATARGGGHS